jgi:hypothetical protein
VVLIIDIKYGIGYWASVRSRSRSIGYGSPGSIGSERGRSYSDNSDATGYDVGIPVCLAKIFISQAQTKSAPISRSAVC